MKRVFDALVLALAFVGLLAIAMGLQSAYMGKPDTWKAVRDNVTAADNTSTLASSTSGYISLRAGANGAMVTCLFDNASRTATFQAWGRLRTGGHGVPFGEPVTFTAGSEIDNTTGQYISDTQLIDLSVYSKVYFACTTPPSSGGVWVKMAQDCDGSQ